MKDIAKSKVVEYAPLMTISEAADYLNVKVSRIRKAIFRKEIMYIKIGSLVRFKLRDLEEFIQSNRVIIAH